MKKYTPMIRQYLEIKKDHEDALLFYRLGDFYELFFKDAEVASQELNLVLTARNNSDEKIPMCGVPHHASASYIYRLASKGYKIAIVEQLENPAEAEGIVKRGVVKIVTPGTIMDELSDQSESIFIAGVHDYDYGYALCLNDMSSGKLISFNVEHDVDKLIASLLNYNTKEVVVQKDLDQHLKRRLQFLNEMTVSEVETVEILNESTPLYSHIDNQFNVEAIQLLLSYLHTTQMKALYHLRPVQLISNDGYLKLDYNALSNLELLETLQSKQVKHSLLGFLDHAQTSMGKRELRQNISRPLINKNDILKRQAQITLLKNDYLLFDDLKSNLKQIFDLERINAKIGYGNVTPLDLLRLKQSLAHIPQVINLLVSHPEFAYLSQVNDVSELHSLLDSAIDEEAKVNVRDGDIFKDGYNQQLDHARSIQKNGQTWILELEAEERRRTDISNLKIGYNRVFGYFIEVSKGNVSKIKDEYGYIRKQTLTNSERYVTETLSNKAEEILNADEVAKELEYKLFIELCQLLQKSSVTLLELSEHIGVIDFIFALATTAKQPGYTLPIIAEDRTFIIEEGRHPILEKIMKNESYVSNHLNMHDEDVWIITGPNMGGKSTFMRQSALIVIMSQMGSYVPASKAVIPIFDQIFTRIGASDDILSGKSTFMVEMAEANDALSHATSNSLIIFDEIGRGTSTYDGMSLAKAMIEYIATNIKAKTLFSTHYHELVSLADHFENVSNYHLRVDEAEDEIILKYEVIAGISNKSYGINVAKLAGLPDVIIKRADHILEHLETEGIEQSGHDIIYREVEIIPKKLSKLLDTLNDLDVNTLTPLMALQVLDDLKKLSDKE